MGEQPKTQLILKALIDASIFKDALSAVTVLVDEARLRITPQGLKLRAIDAANVAMVSMELDRDVFQSYQASEAELGLDLKKLMETLKLAGKGESLSLELEQNSNKLILGFGEFSYTLTLLDPTHLRKEPSEPSLELPGCVVLSGIQFRRAIKAAESISDHLTLGIQAQKFYAEAKGETQGMRFELGKDMLVSITPAEVRSHFSVDYLGDMSGPISRADLVKLEIGNDYPLKISFEFANGKCRLTYLLAPRIEE